MPAGGVIPVPDPAVGRWYRRANGQLFEVVALDSEEGTIDLQFFDGTIDEIDFDIWSRLLIERVAAPEDWSGSVDMDPEDFAGFNEGDLPEGFHDPLEMFGELD